MVRGRRLLPAGSNQTLTKMKVYRQRNSGFIEELNTDGNYIPPGWSKTKAAAKRTKGQSRDGNYCNSDKFRRTGQKKGVVSRSLATFKN